MWVYPELMPGVMIMIGGATAVTMLAGEWRSLDLPGFGWAVLGRLPGLVLGTWLVVTVPAGLTSILVGLAVLLAVALQWTGRSIEKTRGTLLAAGFVSGTTGTVSGIGGPPVAMVYAGQPGPVVRATLAAYFIVGTITSLVALGSVGRVNLDQVGLAVVLLPSLIVGNLLARPFARFLDSGYTRRAILALAGAAGVALVLSNILG